MEDGICMEAFPVRNYCLCACVQVRLHTHMNTQLQ